MAYQNTKLYFLEEDCKIMFGERQGAAIYKRACSMLADLLKKADYRGSEAVKQHMQSSLLPTIAYYKAILEFDYPKKQAYDMTLVETQRAAREQQEKNKGLGRLPLAFLIFRKAVKKVMNKNFPPEGWETEWVRNDRKEVHFNLKSCVYYETTKENGCPELCSVFCENDTTSFEGFAPRILFSRGKTIAGGHSHCDFHFKPGKK